MKILTEILINQKHLGSILVYIYACIKLTIYYYATNYYNSCYQELCYI